MTRGVFALAAITFLAWFVGVRGGGSPTAVAQTNCETVTAAMDGQEMQVLQLVNEHRSAAGLPALLPSPGLARAAAWKSEDRESSYGSGLSHQDSLGRGPTQRGNDCGYPGQVAENLGYGFASPAAMVAAWMDSPGHKANILKPYYVVAGVGHSAGAWTLDFGLVNDSGGNPPPPPPPPATATPVRRAPPTSTSTAVPTATPSPLEAPPFVQPNPAVVPLTGVVVTLHAGTNLVTYAGKPVTVAEAFGNIAGRVAAVHRWDTAEAAWQSWIPGETSSFMLVPGEAYFVHMESAASWAY